MDFHISRKTMISKFKRQSSTMFITKPKKANSRKQSISTQIYIKKDFIRSSTLKDEAIRWLYKIQIFLIIKEWKQELQFF